MALILEAKKVTKRFGGLVAVNNLDFEIPEGSIVSIIGPNGAGKTTFFNCVTGFYEIDQGEITFDGHRLNGLSPDRITRIGISRTFQNIRVFPAMTAIENILVGEHPHFNTFWFESIFRTRRFQKEEELALEEARRLLKFVGLQGLGDQLSRNLPYGSQRRLEIARFIKHLRDELGITILLIEHDMRVVMDISEDITVLDFGEKIAEGNPEEIQSNSRVIEAYLGRGASSGDKQPAQAVTGN
jgi:branched-chain amino acid transport system ATP-binding protein